METLQGHPHRSARVAQLLHDGCCWYWLVFLGVGGAVLQPVRWVLLVHEGVLWKW